MWRSPVWKSLTSGPLLTGGGWRKDGMWEVKEGLRTLFP